MWVADTRESVRRRQLESDRAWIGDRWSDKDSMDRRQVESDRVWVGDRWGEIECG